MSNLLSLLKKRRFLTASSDQYWTCARCGTTNRAGNVFCTECKNRRPW